MAAQTTRHDTALELPGYSTKPPQGTTAQSEHSYALETTKGKKWLLLFVKSRSNDPKSLPIFYEKDIVSGRIELDLEKAETIKGLLVSVGNISGLLYWPSLMCPKDKSWNYFGGPRGRTLSESHP